MVNNQFFLKSGTFLNGGKYLINKVLSQGGFGITYLATRTSDNSNVVIKEYYKKEWHARDIHSSQVSVNSDSTYIEGKFRRKFKKEAETIMKLRHPNIVKVFEFFEENGTLYYSMEYIDGMSISEYVKKNGKLDEKRGIDIIRTVAHTLGYIHSNNELHLDITPRNIMFKKNNQIVLIDFGVSKHYSEDGKQSTSTPVAHSDGYAPKEQYLSEGLIEFSPATDIYALAATFYFMLTGTTPPNSNDRQQFLEEGKEILKIPDALSQRVRNAISAGMCITRKGRLQNTQEFLDVLDGKYVSDEINVINVELGTSESERKVLESLKSNGQIKEAYNYCIDLIRQGKEDEYLKEECKQLIQIIGKETKKDQKRTKIIITAIIIISVLWTLVSLIITNI